MKLLFYGFRHGHVNTLYRSACLHPEIEIAGCIEPDDDARAKAERELGAVFSEQTYDSRLNSDIDAVAIGCAYGDRGDAVIRALQAGKHVISDKPLCTTRSQLETITRLCRENDLKIACMLDLRYLPQTLAARELIASGRLGRVRNIAFNGQHCIDYANRPGWYFEAGRHGGTINDIAIHGIDILPYLTGHCLTSLDAARTWNAFATQHPHFNDCAIFMGRTNGGAGVLADVSYAAPQQGTLPTYWRFEIWCERGFVSLCASEPTVTVYKRGVKDAQILPGEDQPFSMLDEFLQAISAGGQAMTERVLCATHTALCIQQAANRAAEGIPL